MKKNMVRSWRNNIRGRPDMTGFAVSDGGKNGLKVSGVSKDGGV